MNAMREDHVAFERLLDYWFGDTGEADTDAIDEHLMHCDHCGAEVDRIAGLARGARDAFSAGEVDVVVDGRFVAGLVARAVRVREYRVGPGGSVHCTVAPEDEVLVARLEAPLRGVRRLDLVAETASGEAEHFADVPFDETSGEIVLASRIARVRQLPAHDVRMRLLAVADDGSRELAHYTFHHQPWEPA